MPPNTITPPPPSTASPGPDLGGGGGNWLTDHKGIAIAGAVGLLAIIYLYSKSKSSSSASQAGATPSVYELAPGTQLSGTGGATGTSGTGQGGGGGGQLSSALEQIEQEIAAQTTAIQALPGPSGTTNTPGSTGANSGSVPNVGYGQTTIDGTLYDILGQAYGPQYQVSGGAPVYFGGPPGTGDAVHQGAGNETAVASLLGYDYVPASYGSSISSAPVPYKGGPGFF